MMRIIDIPEYRDRKDLLIMLKGDPVLDAVIKMRDMNLGSVMVVDNGKLCGIFTERDLLAKVVANQLSLQDLRLEEVMTQKVETARSEDDVYVSMERMINGRFRHLPIVDENGQLTGMVSQRDFVAITWQQLFEKIKNKTRASFFSFSSVWMLFIGMALYSVLILLIFSWVGM